MPERGGVDTFFQRLGEVLGALQATPGPVHRRIWDELGPWLRELSFEAAPKWLERLSATMPCEVAPIEGGIPRRCPRHAVAVCIICDRPTCLTHAFIDRAGESICYVCASSAVAYRRAHNAANGRINVPRIPPRELAWARRLLRVNAAASIEDIHRAHRKLSAHWHPDRYPPAKKTEAEQRFKDIQRAFDILQKDLANRSAA